MSFAVRVCGNHPAALTISPEGPAPAGLDDALTADVTAEAAPAPAAAPAPPAEGKAKEWMLLISPGFDFMRFSGGGVTSTALGGSLRFGGHAALWGGKRGNFFAAGGPTLHYTFVSDKPARVHIITPNADWAIGGGGRKKWAVYWHGVAGIGAGIGEDSAGTRVVVPVPRLATGVGGFGRINERFSLGGVADVGFAYGLWVEVLVTLNVHFGRGGEALSYP